MSEDPEEEIRSSSSRPFFLAILRQITNACKPVIWPLASTSFAILSNKSLNADGHSFDRVGRKYF
jgi:hypothetical protein